ncbi:hypothetical protein [Actinomadura chokoriensis]|uniref:hypothetical protein n=1 Tax=Actinomadura chokoriensis TaxID=454156 RepID=UPI0031F9EC73
MRLIAGVMGESASGPGGWGVLLRYGEHARELSGFGVETTAELMGLTAVVEGLEALTRPVRVMVWCGGAEVPRPAHGAPVPSDIPDAELYRRLLAMVETHRVEWVDDFNELVGEEEDDEYFLDEFEEPDADHPYERVGDLAYESLVKAEARIGEGRRRRSGKTSLNTALKRFLADERAHLSRREFQEVESVLDTLRWSIGWYSDKKVSAVRAADIADHLPDFYYVVVHKNFADPEELETTGRVMRDFLSHLRDSGQIDAETATSLADDVAERIGDYIAVRRFVNALRGCVEDDLPDLDLFSLDPEDRVVEDYVTITEVTASSITFRDTDEHTIGPVPLPPDVCAMAESGWEVLLTAVRFEGRWVLCQVVNGDP